MDSNTPSDNDKYWIWQKDNINIWNVDYLYDTLNSINENVKKLLKLREIELWNQNNDNFDKLNEDEQKEKKRKIRQVQILNSHLILNVIKLSNWIIDINYQKNLLRRLNILVDPLTWLPNQTQLNLDLKIEEWKKMIFFIKIIDFNKINIIFELNKSEEIIFNISKELQNIFENIWFKVYLINSTTFWFYKKYKDSDLVEIKQSIEKIITTIDLQKTIKQEDIYLNFTAGLSYGENVSVENTFIALEHSNTEKNKKLTVFSKELWKEDNLKYIERNKWQQIIKNAIQKNWIVPFYQWVKNNKTWKIDHVEALMRCYNWNKENEWSNLNEENYINPWLFLKHIKNTLLMRDVTFIMIEKVIWEMKNSNYSFSINIWEKEIMDDWIIKFIFSKLEENNIKPSRLTIEILEETDFSKWLLLRLKELQKKWLQIAIDDFWTWYSTLMRVIKMRTNVKIDKSLIDGTYKDLNLLKLVFKLFKNFNSKTINILITPIEKLNNSSLIEQKDAQAKLVFIVAIVIVSRILWTKIYAEWIEDKETQKLIEKLWIEYSQWFLFSKPSKNPPKH